MSDSRICFVSASGQNVFFAEILGAFAAALREHGLAVEESVDCFPPPAENLVYVYVPHEYHPLVEELAHPTLAQMRRTVAICTEQPGTPWFDLACGIAIHAGSVLDINRLGVNVLNRRGVAAEHVPLGYVPGWDAWGGEAGSERSVDLMFLGGNTERRAQVLSRCGDVMGRRRSSIHLAETTRPHVAGKTSFLSHERKWKALADAHVLMNVHRTALPYMEWHRVIGAVLNGCVVLTEHALGTDPMRPAEHYISSNYEMLPQVLEGLLAEPERLERLRHSAYELVRREMPLSATVDALQKAVERAAANPLPPRYREAPEAVPLPLTLEPPPSGWDDYAAFAGEMLPIRTALKHLVMRTRSLERQLEQIGETGNRGEDVVEHLGPRRHDPRVSVLLTLHNYADYVGEALRSVALSELRELEVVVIDDASTDNSVEVVRESSADLPWLSVKLVRLARNRGLPTARNIALEHANAELLFVLDADNSILPYGLERLAGALERDPEAAFAYGIIQAFDGRGPSGLMNWLDWEPERLREGNYIDAMAMLRRTALEEVGGYATDPTLYGWEDFDLWAKMGSRGMRGVLVRDFVARYRKSPHSMIALANVDTLSTWATLLRRHPGFASGGGFELAGDREELRPH
jgi:hypothetical protein